MIYIAVGTARVYGIPLEKVWAEIQRSNISKIDSKT
jgi:predicted HAD superfamily Cof-like phosphohydrolase